MTTAAKSSLVSTQATLVSTQADMTSQLAEIASNQSELSNNQQGLAERMLEVEEMVLERDRVDPTRTNPDFYSMEGEVVNPTVTVASFRRPSSRSNSPSPRPRTNPYPFESREENVQLRANARALQPRRSQRLMERQLAQHEVEPRASLSSTQDPQLAPSTSFQLSMVARRGEVSPNLLNVQAGGRRLTDKVRANYNGGEYGDNHNYREYDDYDDDDDDEVRQLCRNSSRIVTFRPERMGIDEKHHPTKEMGVLSNRSVGTTTEISEFGETLFQVTAVSSSLGERHSDPTKERERKLSLLCGTSYPRVSEALQTKNHQMQTDSINVEIERGRIQAKESVLSLNQSSHSHSRVQQYDGPMYDDVEMHEDVVVNEPDDYDLRDVSGTRDKLGQNTRGMSARGMNFGNHEIVQSQIARERPREREYMTATVQRSSSEPNENRRRQEFNQPQMRLSTWNRAPPEQNNDDQINRNQFKNVVTSNAPHVTKQKPRPVISETTTLTMSEQRPRMNVDQNDQPSRRFRELPSNDFYDYGPMPRDPYQSSQPNETFVPRPIYERYQPTTTMTTAYANPPNLNPRTGAQRFNPDFQRNDYPPPLPRLGTYISKSVCSNADLSKRNDLSLREIWECPSNEEHSDYNRYCYRPRLCE